MPEVVADPEALHHPAGEVEIALLELDRVFELGIGQRQIGRERRTAEPGIGVEQLRENLDDAAVVPDPLVAPSSGEPEPGTQLKVVAVAVLADAGPARLRDDAVERLRPVLVVVDLDGGVCADDLVEVDVLRGGQRFDAVLEQRIDALRSREAQQNEDVLAEARCQPSRPRPLIEDRIHVAAPTTIPPLNLGMHHHRHAIIEERLRYSTLRRVVPVSRIQETGSDRRRAGVGRGCAFSRPRAETRSCLLEGRVSVDAGAAGRRRGCRSPGDLRQGARSRSEAHPAYFLGSGFRIGTNPHMPARFCGASRRRISSTFGTWGARRP